jgi:Mn-dependent DtxR family transcriptional regulator
MTIRELEKYFCKKNITIKNAIRKMCKLGYSDYKYYENGKVIVSEFGVEWLCKNIFKQKYLELLEKNKMELTEKYIEAGYPYDYFFGKN